MLKDRRKMNKQDLTWLCEKQTSEEIDYINFMADFIALSEDIRIYKEVNGTIESRFTVPKADSYFELYEDGERSGSMFIIEVVKIESEKDLEKVPSDIIAKFIKRRKTNISFETYFKNNYNDMHGKDITLDDIADINPKLYSVIMDEYIKHTPENIVVIPDCFVKCNVVEINGDEHEEWCVRTYHGGFTML